MSCFAEGGITLIGIYVKVDTVDQTYLDSRIVVTVSGRVRRTKRKKEVREYKNGEGLLPSLRQWYVL